jgi:hexosaminidase
MPFREKEHPMKRLALAILLAASAARAEDPVAVIPRPRSVTAGTGAFTLTRETVLAARGEAVAPAQRLAAWLRPATGLPLPVAAEAGGKPAIALVVDSALAAQGPEAYRLEARPEGVTLRAAAPRGLLHAAQTLRQLLPAEIFRDAPAAGVAWAVPSVLVEDAPRLGWRSLHLDVSRHFFDKAFVLRYLDLMAMHKLNVFHWHLSDDQGWRMEVKKYPRLTTVGAWRTGDRPDTWNYGVPVGRDGGGPAYGGFYTQDDIREVVAYAAARGIDILPEIEMPGHSRAAITSYPALACPLEDGKPRPAPNDVYCAGNEETFAFLEGVLDEVVALFPFAYVHVGGDEVNKAFWTACPKCRARMKAEGLPDPHALQSWLMKRMEKHLAAKGRKLIGWDEILEGGLPPAATVMSWRGLGGGIAAARQGHDVVMTPVAPMYFDAAQGRGPDEPKTIGYAPNPIQRVYAFNPVPAELTPEQARHVIGAGATAWTEWMFAPARVEFMVWPRACAMAEVAWTAPARQDFDSFAARLAVHTNRLAARGVNFRPLRAEEKPAGRWTSGETAEAWAEKTWDVTALVREPGAYEVLFQYTGGAHRLDVESAELVSGGAVLARDAHPGMTGAADKDNRYALEVKAAPAGPVLLRAKVRSDGGNDSSGDIYIRRKSEI